MIDAPNSQFPANSRLIPNGLSSLSHCICSTVLRLGLPGERNLRLILLTGTNP